MANRTERRSFLDESGPCRAAMTGDEVGAARDLLDRHGGEIERMNRFLEPLGSLRRLQLAFLLHRQRRMCVCDLADVLGITSSAVSQHLRRMKDLGLVAAKRDGQTVFHGICDPEFDHFMTLVLSAARARGPSRPQAEEAEGGALPAAKREAG